VPVDNSLAARRREECSCCHRRVWLATTMPVGGSVVFCRECRPPDEVLADFDRLLALVGSLIGPEPGSCQHPLTPEGIRPEVP
jgi:hypothetical protein